MATRRDEITEKINRYIFKDSENYIDYRSLQSREDKIRLFEDICYAVAQLNSTTTFYRGSIGRYIDEFKNGFFKNRKRRNAKGTCKSGL